MATTMTKPLTTELLTATDLLRLAGEGVRGELIRGVLHETMMTGVEHGEIVMESGRRAEEFHQAAAVGHG